MMSNKEDKSYHRMRKFSLIMEKFWLVLAIASLLVVFYIFYQNRNNWNSEMLTYLVFPALAGAMYAFRTFMRKRLEKTQNREE